MRKEGIWQDLIHELYSTGWDAYRQGLDDGETRRYAARRLYAFLKAYGFHRRRRHNTKPEIPFTIALQYSRDDRDPAPRVQVPYLNTDHLDEEILGYIKQHPDGLTRARIGASFQITVKEVECYLVGLKEKGLVVELKRENIRGRPLSPLLLDASQPAPKLRTVARERDERIRKAYFVEGKSIKQIKRELHHDKRIIRRAIYKAQPS